jgi:hypothetical protein
MIDSIKPVEDIEPQILSLRVINFNDFAIVDRFDGTVFRFDTNIPKDVPIDAAHHIFGWFPPFTDKDGERREVDPEIMRAHCQRRFGWNTPKLVESGAANEFFNRLQFRPILFRMVPMLVDDVSTNVQGPAEVPSTNAQGKQVDFSAQPAPQRAPKVNKMSAADEPVTRR